MSKKLQLLRNSTVYNSRAIALGNLTAKLESAADGEPILARYYDENSQVVTILGIAGTPGENNANGSYTIFDTKEIAANLDDAVAKIIGIPEDASDDAKTKFINNTIWKLDQALKTEITTRGTEDAAIKGELEPGDYDTLKALSDALKAGVAEAKTEVKNAEGNTHITVTGVATSGEGADGHMVYTIAENDIASATALSEEVSRAEAAESALDVRLNVIEGSGEGSVAKAQADAEAHADDLVNDLDYTVSAESNQFLTGFEIEDGKLKANSVSSATFESSDNTIVVNGFDLKANIDGETIVADGNGKMSVASAALTQYVGSDAVAISEVDATHNTKTVSLVISSDDKFLAVSNAEGKEGLIAKVGLKRLTAEEVTDLADSNVKEAYKLVDKDGNAVEGAATIKIYKDSSVKDVHIGVPANGEDAQKLYLTYIKVDGSEEKVDVDFSSFIAEAEMGDGMKVVDHKVSIDLASGAEYIKFTEAVDGHKQLTATGIDDAIATAKAAATTVVKNAAADQQFVTVTKAAKAVGETFDTYTVAVNDIASATALSEEVTRAKAAEKANADAIAIINKNDDTQAGSLAKTLKDAKDYADGKVNDLNMTAVTAAEGEFISQVSETKGIVSAETASFADTVDATYNGDAGKVAPTAKAVRTAIDAAAAKATTVVSGETATSGPAVKVTVDNSATDGHIEYKIAGQDLASAALLNTVNGTDATEGSFRKAVKDAKEAIIGTASTAYDTLKKIEDKLSALEGSAVKNITVNGVGATVANNAATVTIGGANIKLENYAKATADAAIAATDTVNAALGKLEYGMDNTLESVAEGNGISITAKANQSQTITAKAVENDPVIEVTANGIGTKADAVWDCGTY